MTMEKRNVLEEKRTPPAELELEKQSSDHIKEATAMFKGTPTATGKPCSGCQSCQRQMAARAAQAKK